MINNSKLVKQIFSDLKQYNRMDETILQSEQEETKRTIMLWKDDFVYEKDWEAICQVLNIGLDTQTLELKASVIVALPYKKQKEI